MATPPGSHPPRAGSSEPDGLLATKLHLPHPPLGYVRRPRLADLLNRGLGHGLILVCAPAGFGKTALLAAWARATQQPAAWLSLDTGDNDPARFWRHVAAALDRARPGIAERAALMLGPQPPQSFEGLVTALINELAAQPGADQVLLVLDDYHLIDSPTVHASFEFLVQHRPPGLTVTLASRSDPPLPLPRLRGRGQLAELRAADLRFTAGEAADLLHAAAGPGLTLPDTAVAALADRTEGWAAGLQLAGLSLRGQADVAGLVASFGGSHRYVLDYLTDEVLNSQPEPVRSFLVQTSVLDRLSGPLCDAVTGRADSQAMLEAIEQAGLFLVPLDEVRGWWRYHPLFADLLRTRLPQEQPGRAPALHRNAASWCEKHRLADDAVQHAVAAGDAEWAARLVESHADGLLVRSEGATLARWLAALPAELAGSRPRLLLAQALLALHSGRVEQADASLEAAERALAGADGMTDESYAPSAGRAASLLANVPAALALDRAYLAGLRGDADRAAAFASQGLAQIGESERMLGSIGRDYLAIAEWLRGRLAEAERAFASSLTGWRAAGQRFVAVRVCELLGQVQRAQGRLDAAVETCQQALQIAAEPGRPPLPAAGIAYVGLAEVAYQRDDLDTALRQVTEGIARSRELTYTQSLATGLAIVARIRHATGDPSGALDAMREAEQAAPGRQVVSLLNSVTVLRARLMLALGDIAAVSRWARERGLDAGDDPAYAREPEYLVLARLLLAQHRPAQALGLLERLHETAASQGRLGSVIEVRALQALALAASGDEPGAITILAEAVSLARPQGYVRVFAEMGPAMAALLGRLISAQRTGDAPARGIPLGYLARLVRACEQPVPVAASPASAGTAVAPVLPEALTERELEVLQLLAAGKENQAIAKELVVAVSTVKKHVTHILEKLGAANRTEATARARELGLLPDPAAPARHRSAAT